MFYDGQLSWETAIRKSCEPLQQDGTVDDTYADEIIKCIKQYGPYIIILPGVALPHSTQNAKGAHRTAIGFMKCSVPVSFQTGNKDKNAQIFFTISSTNSDEHLANMQRLYTILSNEDVLEKLKQIKDPKELLEIDRIFEN